LHPKIKGILRIFFIGVPRPKAKSWGGELLEEMEATPPHQLEGLEKRCELPQRGSGQSPYRPKVFHFSTRGWPVSILLIIIVDYHAAIVGAKTPCLPLAYAPAKDVTYPGTDHP